LIARWVIEFELTIKYSSMTRMHLLLPNHHSLRVTSERSLPQGIASSPGKTIVLSGQFEASITQVA
jgi:hypothetical protein